MPRHQEVTRTHLMMGRRTLKLRSYVPAMLIHDSGTLGKGRVLEDLDHPGAIRILMNGVRAARKRVLYKELQANVPWVIDNLNFN